jgi:hypothetical protein
MVKASLIAGSGAPRASQSLTLAVRARVSMAASYPRSTTLDLAEPVLGTAWRADLSRQVPRPNTLT